MEIQQIRGFQAVARYKNFTVAAKKTRRTQPTISLQVKALEEELGVKLFERLGPKQIHLTPEGELLYDLTLPLLELFDEIPARFNEARNIFSATSVKIVTHRSIMTYILPTVVKSFREQFPDCKLCILNRTRAEILTMLEEGEAEIGITSLEPIPANIEYETISKFNRILIGPTDHPLAKKNNIGLEDISKYPLILPLPGSNTRRKIDQAFAAEDLRYHLAMEVVGRDAIKTYASMGVGLSIMNEYYVSKEDKKKLFVKNVTKFFGNAETGIAVRSGRKLSHPAEVFMKLVKKSIKEK